MLKNYIKIALKVLLRRKFFTFISLFGISFTLLILVVVTSVIDHTFGPQYPEKKLDRTLTSAFFKITGEGKNYSQGALISYYTLNRYVKTLQTPEKVAIFSIYGSTIAYKGNKKFDFEVKYTDSEFWEILDFDFIEGKPFTNDDIDNASNVAVINEDTKKKYFGNNSALGDYIEADGTNYRVVGVVKNVSSLKRFACSDIWMPVTTSKDDLKNNSVMQGGIGYGAYILAYDKSDFPKIKNELKKNLSMVEFQNDKYDKITGSADTYLETISRIMFMDFDNTNTAGVLSIMIILMVLFMLLPTINLVNINVSRIMERASEIGIRKSFGASSLTLVGQFIVENVILTLIGGILSLIFSQMILNIINNSSVLPHIQLELNFRIFLASLVLVLFFGLFSGVYPAFKMSRLKPVDALKGVQS